MMNLHVEKTRVAHALQETGRRGVRRMIPIRGSRASEEVAISL
jgi:hypothetical protein